MAFGVGDGQGIQPKPVQVADSFETAVATLKEVTEGIKTELETELASFRAETAEQAQDLKEEGSLATNRERGQVKADDAGAGAKFTTVAQAKKPTATPEKQQSGDSTQQGKEKISDKELAALIAGLLDEEEVKKKSGKKRKSKWEEQLERLEKLDGAFDLSGLSPEEREIVEEFFDNMARIREKQSKLKQLESQEEYYLELIKKLREERAAKRDAESGDR